MADDIRVGGGCACGEIRYECTEEPLFVFLCHRVDCRKATGATFAPNVFFTPSAIKFSGIELKAHVQTGQTGESVHHEFCPNCGSPVGMRGDAYPIIRGVRASSLDDPTGLKPVANVWTSTALPWDHLNPDLIQFETQPTEEEFARILGNSS
jgi:hypothetical protein